VQCDSPRVAAMAATVCVLATPADADAGRVYTASVSSSFVGNDWRQHTLRIVGTFSDLPPGPSLPVTPDWVKTAPSEALRKRSGLPMPARGPYGVT